MDISANFYYQPGFVTIKIDNKLPYTMLSPEDEIL